MQGDLEGMFLFPCDNVLCTSHSKDNERRLKPVRVSIFRVQNYKDLFAIWLQMDYFSGNTEK